MARRTILPTDPIIEAFAEQWLRERNAQAAGAAEFEQLCTNADELMAVMPPALARVLIDELLCVLPGAEDLKGVRDHIDAFIDDLAERLEDDPEAPVTVTLSPARAVCVISWLIPVVCKPPWNTTEKKALAELISMLSAMLPKKLMLFCGGRRLGKGFFQDAANN